MLDGRRTHTCGDLTKEHIGMSCTLCGWVHRRRDHGGLIFIDLRDRFGLTQLVFDPNKNPTMHLNAEQLRSEFVLIVQGVVHKRAEGMTNKKLATGEIEIYVEQMEITAKAKTPPFSISDELITINEELRLKYRYLDIRRGNIAQKLVKRHQAVTSARNFLNSQGFIDIATPILGKSTPEGARDYLVPSRIQPGAFYALPQSPQLFKQLLMIAGMDRYYQVATCFRDEDLRADRQPEFTQIDIEMSFGNPEMLQSIIEKMVCSIFESISELQINLPFPRIQYQDAIDRFGTDRPDTRFSMELFSLTELAKETSFSVFHEQINNNGIIKGICLKGGAELSRKAIENYIEFVSKLGVKGLSWVKVQDNTLQTGISKFIPDALHPKFIQRAQAEAGDLIFIIADQPSLTNLALDHLRRKLALDLNLIPHHQFNFLWVTDFPLFSWNTDEKRLDSEHHPFTSPHPEDLHLLEKQPLKVRSLGYDLILNGYEIGGGSQRIHHPELQQQIFQLLNISESEQKEKFGFFLDAMEYGTPPHLGIALGLDRMLMIATNSDSIKDVIAFPKTQKASDLMLQCPAPVAANQLKELKLNLEE